MQDREPAATTQEEERGLEAESLQLHEHETQCTDRAPPNFRRVTHHTRPKTTGRSRVALGGPAAHHDLHRASPFGRLVQHGPPGLPQVEHPRFGQGEHRRQAGIGAQFV